MSQPDPALVQAAQRLQNLLDRLDDEQTVTVRKDVIAAFGAAQRADTLEQAISTVKAYKPPPTTLYYSTADMLEHIVAALRAARPEGT